MTAGLVGQCDRRHRCAVRQLPHAARRAQPARADARACREHPAVVGGAARPPAVRQVYYPGLPDHPGHEIARRQQSGFGAMLSFELAGGEEAVRAFLDGLAYFTLAESLGGVESLIAHPASMTHAGMDGPTPGARRHRSGVLRVSVGIEDRPTWSRICAKRCIARPGASRPERIARRRPAAPNATIRCATGRT